uniref:Uncharacterized protein n=1 Tax=Anguilla anguilla TaxID=7936 RepID=A0A0E9VC67_ANGAN
MIHSMSMSCEKINTAKAAFYYHLRFKLIVIF